MDTNPSFSISCLYRTDPVYSLCAADLMTASQTVNNNFIKEQKNLMKTLKVLEQQRVLRMRQLSEEQRTFAFVMNNKLRQRNSVRPLTVPSTSASSYVAARSVKGPRSAPASLANRGNRTASAKSAKSAQSANSRFEQSSSNPVKLQRSVEKQDRGTAEPSTVLKESGALTRQRCCCECGYTRKLLNRRLSCPAVIERHYS
ncbi:hypothetical protein UPYG_G00162010 [Umbra pygmaea]|uniref:Uncharacterized protein n=1 Tax=Umbra pygmaea TaxID=75934 RepID=A0ABD0WLU0_UMBPY